LVYDLPAIDTPPAVVVSLLSFYLGNIILTMALLGIAASAIPACERLLSIHPNSCGQSEVGEYADPACQVFSLLLFGSSFLVPFIYPNVGKDVLHFTFWGLIIAACVQPAKVLNSILGNGILPSGGDTKYILISHVIGSYAIGVPSAIFSGFVLHLSVWGVFGSRALEEMLKAIFFLRRYRTPSWYKKSVELSDQSKKSNAQSLSL
jgi:hypothetical protein